MSSPIKENNPLHAELLNSQTSGDVLKINKTDELLADIFHKIKCSFDIRNKTIDEQSFLVSHFFEEIDSIKDENLKNIFLNLPFKDGKSLKDLKKTLENAAPDTLCVQNVVNPILHFIKHYSQVYKLKDAQLEQIDEEEEQEIDS